MTLKPTADQDSSPAANARCVAIDGLIKDRLGHRSINAAKRAVEEMLDEAGEGGSMMYKLSKSLGAGAFADVIKVETLDEPTQKVSRQKLILNP